MYKSEDESLPKEQRKAAYVESIRSSECSVVLVSAADKLHNIKCYAQNPELFKKEVVVFYAKLIPVYVDKLGLNHRFVWEMIKIWEELTANEFEIERIFLNEEIGLCFDQDDLASLASREDYELSDRCVGSVFEALSPGEVIWLKEGLFCLDDELDLVELAL